MTTIKERLRESQGTGNSFPKLEIVHRIELKENDEKQPYFGVYNKESKLYQDVEAPIQGIFIGAGMQLSSYSDNLGKSGGNYQSDYYFSNEHLSLFAPTAKGYDIVCKGNMETVEGYIKQHSTGNAKKKQVLFILTSAGLITITTNLSIAIDQLHRLKEELTEKYIVLTPELFAENSTTISKRAKEYLGKFRTKNPPKYAEITAGELISEEDWSAWGADKTVFEFTEFKKAKLSQGGTKEKEVEPESDFVFDKEDKKKMTPNEKADENYKGKHETNGHRFAPEIDKHKVAEPTNDFQDLPF